MVADVRERKYALGYYFESALEIAKREFQNWPSDADDIQYAMQSFAAKLILGVLSECRCLFFESATDRTATSTAGSDCHSGYISQHHRFGRELCQQVFWHRLTRTQPKKTPARISIRPEMLLIPRLYKNKNASRV
jgi:hypothetical protein